MSFRFCELQMLCSVLFPFCFFFFFPFYFQFLVLVFVFLVLVFVFFKEQKEKYKTKKKKTNPEEYVHWNRSGSFQYCKEIVIYQPFCCLSCM